MKTSVLRATGSVASLASCLVLFGGVASAYSITDSGRDSNNVITLRDECKVSVNNVNDIIIRNNNPQDASSGNSNVSNNDDLSGSTSTGDASNSSSASFNVNVENSSAPSCAPEQVPVKEVPREVPSQSSNNVVTPTASSTPVGSRGGGEVAAAPQFAAVPVGGVGAGSGSPAYLASLIAVTLFSGALGAFRLQKSFRRQL
jgi:hypothetical protein